MNNVTLHPNAEDIKKFEITLRPMGSMKNRVTMTVSREWIFGKRIGDFIEAETSEGQFRGEVMEIKPIREDV